MENFYTSYVHIYIFTIYFTTHLIMTEARSKRRVLPLVLIVKSTLVVANVFPSSNGKYLKLLLVKVYNISIPGIPNVNNI